ncbi:two-component system sensor kinase [Escherichia coli]|uniref:Two-component system sensor kinase n=1 Tax=Escherichia coli TaxID=562 RepID=A0A376W8E7_ECOLX|nr:two-component system sensor kinase [Escherichia coli]
MKWQIRQSFAPLQSKINPHFLFNALNAISSSIRLNPDTARQLIFNLSRYLRYNIELKDDEQIDIKKELYQIKDYIAIGAGPLWRQADGYL